MNLFTEEILLPGLQAVDSVFHTKVDLSHFRESAKRIITTITTTIYTIIITTWSITTTTTTTATTTAITTATTLTCP